jgi:hypothetical protein
MSSTMMAMPTSSSSLLGGGPGRATQVANPSAPMTSSLGMSGAAGGASNQDLKSRLDEMKARLAAMKKN